MKTRASFLIRVGALAATWALGLSVARADPAAPPIPAPPIPPASATPPAGEPVGIPGARMATGQAPVVGGNSAGARERALDEAIRQAVDQALVDLVDPTMRAAQAKGVRAIEAKSRTFVPRYRTLEENETNGVYTIRLEAEVDEVALRRRIDRWSANALGSTAPAHPSVPALAVVAGDATVPAFAGQVTTALAALGVRVRGGSGVGMGMPAPTGAPVLTVNATVHDEGPVRGTGRVSVSCQAGARFSGLAAPARDATARAFGESADPARADCLTRLAAALAAAVAPALTATAAPTDLPILTIDADVVEPAAVAALLKSVRAVGAVSAADLVRLGGGRAEIRARTRSAAGPVAAALSRDADAVLTLSDVQPSGDVIRLRARLRAPASPETGATP